MTGLSGADVERAISVAAEQLGVQVGTGQAAALAGYLDLIRKWNRVYNLTSIRDPEEMLTQHLFDSLAVIPSMLRQLRSEHATLIDVGSGAGLPGVVIAISCPDIQVTCVDTVGKKASFIQQVASELRLKNLVSRHARIEKLDNAQVDLVTARAFSSLTDLVSLSDHVLKPEGCWMALKGKRPDNEIRDLPATIEVFHVEPISVAGLYADRCLVWMRRR